MRVSSPRSIRPRRAIAALARATADAYRPGHPLATMRREIERAVSPGGPLAGIDQAMLDDAKQRANLDSWLRRAGW